jgi:uncharacterized protein (DUF362 family)
MKASQFHEIYSRDAIVYLVKGKNKIDTFLQVVEQSRFVPHLLKTWKTSGKTKKEFNIVLKPNLMTASTPVENNTDKNCQDKNSPVYTDPELLELLIEIMYKQGFRQFYVVETENVYNYSYTKRRVRAVAEMCGYSGKGYGIVDLAEDTVKFNYGGALKKHPIGRVWLEADYRISFAKNKTHWQCYYTACLKNVYGCLPEWDKMRFYHGRNIEFFQANILIAEKAPVHFGFLDAWTSGDGLTGHVRDAQPNITRTFISSENIYALDWVAGEKMGIKPTDNYVIQEAMRRWGTIKITRQGDMTKWFPWNNVRPFIVKILNIMEEFYWVSRLMSRAFASQMDPRFLPVSRWQWFFGFFQGLTRLIERMATQKTYQLK